MVTCPTCDQWSFSLVTRFLHPLIKRKQASTSVPCGTINMKSMLSVMILLHHNEQRAKKPKEHCAIFFEKMCGALCLWCLVDT